MIKTMRCPLCEKGTVTPVSMREPMPYRHFAALEPAWAVDVPTCDRCGERIINKATARALDASLEAALRKMQSILIEEALTRLETVKTHREWEKRLDLSVGYLSRLKSGKESSIALTTLLILLSQSPARSWERLNAIWSPR